MPLNCISTESLTNGEIIALDALEIVSIPHISIIDDRENAITEIVEKYKDISDMKKKGVCLILFLPSLTSVSSFFQH